MAKIPKRFALDFDPPTIILEYQKDGGLYHYHMRLKNLTSESDPEKTAKALVERHLGFIDRAKINNAQVQKLVGRLIDHLNGAPLPAKPSNPSPLVTSNPHKPTASFQQLPGQEFGDLNKVSEFDLQKAKDKMNETFEATRISRDDPNYIHDKRVDFGPPVEDNDWDDDSEEEPPAAEPPPRIVEPPLQMEDDYDSDYDF